ncbi:uncharacterized protein LOC110452354 [Mizuhopecten yessoensis]|uniref:uncharacterized protein LOC110452354 n=1 Tax=Mizuhopecten yessoensis TaxID=6573 RepID=UPI000B45C9C1|nr:uncharacterized protein LOC110452354 [Mizuhopecten yessoensis]
MSKLFWFRNIANFVFRGCSKAQHDMFNTITNRQVHATCLVQAVIRDTLQSSDDLNSESQPQEKNNSSKKIKPPSLRDLWKSDTDVSSQQKKKQRTKPGDNIAKQKSYPRHNKNNSLHMRVGNNSERGGKDDLKFKPFSLPKDSDNTWADTEVRQKWNKKRKCYTEDLDEESTFEEGHLDLNGETRSHRDEQWNKQLESFKWNMEQPEKGKK